MKICQRAFQPVWPDKIVYKICQNMILLEKWIILAPLRKLANNVGNLGKIIVATGFEWLPKVQKIAQSGHTAYNYHYINLCQSMHTF